MAISAKNKIGFINVLPGIVFVLVLFMIPDLECEMA